MPHDDHDHTGHDHSHAPTTASGNERKVLIAFVITFSFMIVEVIGGLVSGSLALLADAGHMLTDAVALALSWLAFYFGKRVADARRTFGYRRLEVIAAFVNALTLFLIVLWIMWEAWKRISAPHDILSGPMLLVAVTGLIVNLIVLKILSRGDTDHVNIQGAMLHVLGDLLGSVGAIGAALIIHFTGWTPIDPILSVLVALLILRSAWFLARRSLNILLEGAPAGISSEAVATHIRDSFPEVAEVSHIHIWQLTQAHVLATLHLQPRAGARLDDLGPRVSASLQQAFGIGHSTVALDLGMETPECTIPAPAPQSAHTHATGQDG